MPDESANQAQPPAIVPRCGGPGKRDVVEGVGGGGVRHSLTYD